ncbi:carbohydrate kinase family protein [Vibrio sp. SA48]|uniref:carbohydrate kinase family protein n=1 Tax=Vibrio sp. S12_S33 TaxID=2720223 RepID=UPI00177B6F1E|nr:carbohydrate kinase family protein [Vibrio sp. S12_S33]MBD1566504.1 carbohydrate kinase family protein [Vibrio sp. S12_S33]
MRQGILAAGNMLVDYVHSISDWPEQGRLAEITGSESATGGSPLNLLFTLDMMQVSFPLQAMGLLGRDTEADFILQQLASSNIDWSRVKQTDKVATSMTQVMSIVGGQRTFFHRRGANALLNLSDFEAIHSSARIFHLGYLLLLDKLDCADPEYGSVGAKVIATMRAKGMKTSLDLVSESDSTRYQRLVVPALCYTDYLVINELEAMGLTDICIRQSDGSLDSSALEQAALKLLQMGVRERVVIHCPEGACGVQAGQQPVIQPSYEIDRDEIKGTVGAGDAFCAGFLYACHESFDMSLSLKIANACAHFCLTEANANDGIVALHKIKSFVESNVSRQQLVCEG